VFLMRILFIVITMFFVALLLGCISEPQPVQKEYAFSDGLTELQAIEAMYGLGNNTTTIENLDSCRLALTTLKSKFESYNETRDVSALKSLTGFRMSYLDVQMNAKLGLEKLNGVNLSCSNNVTISDAIVNLQYAIDNGTITAGKFQEFKANYPEYLSKTNINSNFDSFIIQTSSQLNDSVNQIKTQLKGCI